MPGWPVAAEEPERRQLLELDGGHVRFRHELARNAVLSGLPAVHAARAPRARCSARCSPRARTPPTSCTTREAAGDEEVRERVRADRGPPRRRARVEPRGVLPLPAGRRLRRPAARARAGGPARGAGDGRLPRRQARRRLRRDRGRDRASTASSATRPRSAAAPACCRASTGSWATASPRARRRSRRSRSSSRSASRSSSRAPAAASRSSRCSAEDTDEALRWGQRALDLATRLGDESTRAHALVNIACTRVQMDPARRGALLEAHALADAAGEREDATRALGNLGYVLMSWAMPEAALRYAEQARRLRRAATRCTRTSRTCATTLAWLRLRRGDWDEAERVDPRRDRARHHHRPAAREDGAGRARGAQGRPGRARARGRARRARRPRRRAAADRSGPRARDRAGADGRRARCRAERFERLAELMRAHGGLRGRYAGRLAAWAAVGGDRDRARLAGAPARTRRWCGATGRRRRTRSASSAGRTSAR